MMGKKSKIVQFPRLSDLLWTPSKASILFFKDADTLSVKQKNTLARISASPLSEEAFQEESRAVVIYPNPAAEIITVTTQVDVQSPVSVSIYNISGITVLSKEFRNVKGHFEERFDISSLPSGVFILKLGNGNRIVSKKFVKMPKATN